MIQVSPIPAFNDNYIWCLSRDNEAGVCVVDPGSAEAVIEYLRKQDKTLSAIMITHHHADHVGGVDELVKQYGCPVIGSSKARFNGITEAYDEGEQFTLMSTRFTVIAVPGHTLDHIAFYSPPDKQHHAPWLFCGDTLFAGGCGRIFEGDAAMMWSSLQRLNALPPESLVFCAHEYTLTNLRFARHVMPDDEQFKQFELQCQKLRGSEQPTVPTTLATERQVNVFLRAAESQLAKEVLTAEAIDKLDRSERALHTFAQLRQRKDRF